MTALIGTASGLHDFAEQLVNFVTTNATLVANGEEWTVMRHRPHRLANITVNNTTIQRTSDVARRAFHLCRWESRSLNVDDVGSTTSYPRFDGSFPCSIECELTASAEVSTLKIRAAGTISAASSATPKDFSIQFSDDGSSWTTAASVSGEVNWGPDEVRSFAVPSSGAHLHWRISVSAAVSSSSDLEFDSLIMEDSSGNIVNHYGDEVILRGQGSSGVDEIYVGFRTEHDPVNDWHNMILNGFTGYNSSDDNFFTQPGGIDGFAEGNDMGCPMVPLWDQTIQFWISTEGRCIRFACKVSTSFEAGYLGFFLPYAAPSQYPYPMAIGGSLMNSSSSTNSRKSEWRFSYNNFKHSCYVAPSGNSGGSTKADSTLMVRTAGGQWKSFSGRNSSSNADTLSRMVIGETPPFAVSGVKAGVWPSCSVSTSSSLATLPLKRTQQGGYAVEPCALLIGDSTDRAVLGILDGVEAISGDANAPENTTLIDGNNYVVLQNASRAGIGEFFVMRIS